MPVLIQRERNNRWLDLAVVLTLVALITLDISIFLKPTNNPTPAEARAAELVEGWLREQKKGGDGLRFWAPGELIEPAQFHAVRSWKMIHVEPFDHALVQVDSRTAGGDPVSRLWKVSLGMGPDRAPLITRIVDAGDLSPPTHLLARVMESPRTRQMRLQKEQAEAKLAGLSRKLHELENDTVGKLSRLTDSLIQQKRDMNRQIEDQTYWLERLTAQIETTRNEVAAAKDRARSVQTADFRFTLPALGVSNAKRVTQLASTVSAPMPVDQAYHYFLKKAEDVYRAGNYPEAAGMYSELIEKYPKARTPYLRRGDCYASLEEFDRAIADFDAAIKLLPLEPRAYLARSWAHLSKGATNLALADAEPSIKVVSSQPANWDANKAGDIMNTVLQQHPNLCGTLSVWGPMAAGAAEAIKNVGKNKIKLYIASDGQPNDCDMVDRGLSYAKSFLSRRHAGGGDRQCGD